MRFLDLLGMSVNNLRRRKVRTALTVLGVVVGTASIVVMVSLGIGLKELMQEQVESYGSLTQISVYSDAKWAGVQDGKTEPNYMTDKVVESFKKISHVTGASPILETYVLMKQGVYEANISLMGVNQDYLQKIPLKEGRLPDKNAKTLEMVIGNKVISRFSNPKEQSGMMSYSMGGEVDSANLPNVDFMNKPLFVILDTDTYYSAMSGGTTEAGTPIKPPKKYMIPTVGLVEGTVDDWNDYSYNVYVDIDLLKTQLKQAFKKKLIPNQPTNKKGKPFDYFIYDQAIVDVDDMSNVIEVQNAINAMGFQASSNVEWLESSQKQAGMIQAVLGGIGGVSLLVAAIGIANTMMMSIYERTKEIGVIKVLGCDMGNIRNMFLIESGFIGFLGGVVGILLSYGVSLIMNKVLMGKMMGMMMVGEISGNLSRIPGWLALSAMGFAVLVGMVAGFFPSLRAMKLSPLAAIRNE